LPRARCRRRPLFLVSIQATIARRSSYRVSQCLVSRTFFCSRAKKLSMAALSPAEATRPMEPTRPLFFSRRITFFDRNWLPLSEWQTDTEAVSQGGSRPRSVVQL
jgi:hypothetical protein